ncbi:hypothetical protein DO64_1292 [Burkholderia pseudomallei]|nr:hypothetical protein DO64_1292 [Burkholderia pseudomallei]
MRRGATHRRVERRRADRNGERQTPSADAVRARTAANLRTAFGRQRCNACRAGVRRIRGRRRSCASRCELANGISSATASTLGTPAFTAYAADAVPARTAANLRTAFVRRAATLVAPAFAAYARRRAAGHVTEHETARGRRRRRQARRGRSPFSCRRPLDRATSRRERRSTPTTTTKSAANAPRRFTRSEPTGESASRRSMQPAPHRTASHRKKRETSLLSVCAAGPPGHDAARPAPWAHTARRAGRRPRGAPHPHRPRRDSATLRTEFKRIPDAHDASTFVTLDSIPHRTQK